MIKKSIKINDLIKDQKNSEAIEEIEKGFDVNKTYKEDEFLNFITGKQVDLGTPLYTACRYRNGEMIQFLLERGADPNVCRFETETPIEIFLNYSYDLGVNLLKLLLDKGADLSKYEVKPAMCCLMSHYFRADDSMKELIEEELMMLLDHGASWRNDDLKTPYGGYSVLHFVAAAGRYDFFKKLLNYPQAKECINSVNDSRMTPFEMAKNNKREDICNLISQFTN